MRYLKQAHGLLILIGLIVGNKGSLWAQNNQLTKVVTPSPEVMAMQKYGDIPVSTYNGIPNISLPLYTIKSHDITVPISLSYHASGIKVNENASRVGLGWVINAGGSISRNVVGFDDFNSSRYLNTSTMPHPAVMDFENGKGPAFTQKWYLNMSPVAPLGLVPIFDKKGPVTLQDVDFSGPLATTSVLSDFQPDQFYYNAPGGLSGKFVIKRNREVVMQDQQKIKITCLNDSGTSWTITGQDGTVYTFDKIESNFNNSDPTVINTAWHLTNITSAKGNQVNFVYTTLPNQLQPSSTFSESVEVFKGAPAYSYTANLGTTTPPVHAAVFGNIYTLQVLSYIDYDNGRVYFNYSDDRQDLSGEKRLESISIHDKDASGNVNTLPVKTEVFDYNYFTSGDVGNKFNAGTGGDPLKRLKLLSVVENGYFQGKIVPGSPYQFSYYEGSANTTLPPKTSFAIDHWGYFNGRLSNTTFIPTYVSTTGTTIADYYVGYPGPEREPDTSYVKAFSLSSITYPTGGTTYFQYEANDFDNTKSTSNDNSANVTQKALVNKTANFTYYNDTHQYIGSNLLDMTNEYKDANGNIVSGKLNVAFRLSGGQGVINSLQQNLMYISVRDAGNNEVMHIDPANYTATPQFAGGPYYSYSNNSSVISLNNVPLSLQPGVYTWTAYCGTSNYAAFVMDIHSIFTWTEEINYDLSNSNSSSPTAYLAGGGMRIKRIIDRDGINSTNDKIKKFVYHYFATGPDNLVHEYSYGKRMSKPQYSFWKVTHDVYQDTYATPPSALQINVMHLIRSSESNISLSGSGAGAVVAYDKVVVLNGENGENGKSEYSYFNETDYIAAYQNSYNFYEKPPYNSNLPNSSNGSLLKQIDYVNLGGVFTKIHEVNNLYSSDQTLENEVFGMEKREIPWVYYVNGTLGSNVMGIVPRPCENLELFAYRTLVSKFNFLFFTEEKLYNPGDTTKAVSTVTYNFHDNKNHLLTTRTVKVNSKGEKVTTSISYPLDYIYPNINKSISKSIEALKAKNIVAAPIETFTNISNGDNTNNRVTAGYLMSYNQNTAYPDTVFQLQSVTPVTSFARLKDTTYARNAAYKPVIVFDQYDGKGNITRQHKVDDVNHFYLWGYNANYPVAEVIGSSNVIAYTSFEGATNYTNTAPTNFSYYGANYFDPTSPTGKYCYNLAGGSVSYSYSFNASPVYVVSYWTKNTTAYTIAGTIAGYPKQGKTLNGWTYFEHKITGVTGLTLSGSGYIDELRLYADGSLMTTYAFDSSAGMTESMDAKGQLTRFEYDGAMRLQNIKDQYGSIIKNYQYNYSSLAVPNQAISNQSYTRNNCPPNTTPGAPVLVSVPAGKYYGFNQAAANAAAQADLDYNAQSYANANCSCTATSVTVTLTNSTGVSGFQAYFSGYNSFAFPANGTTTITVPAGTYNITINPINAPTTRKFTLSSSSTGGSTVVTAPGTTFSSIAVNTGVNNVLTIQAP